MVFQPNRSHMAPLLATLQWYSLVMNCKCGGENLREESVSSTRYRSGRERTSSTFLGLSCTFRA